MKVLTFGLDNNALLDIDGHSKRWNSRIGKYVDRLDVIVQVQEKTKISEKYIADNVRIIPIYVPYPAFYSFIAYKKALEEHEKNGYDLITTEEPFRTGFAGWLFKRKTGVALSVEYHNDTFYNRGWLNERPVSHRIYITIGKMVVGGADSIRCVNRKNFLDLKRICHNDSAKLIEIIPVPTEFYNKEKHGVRALEIRKETIKNKDDLLILFVGRLVPIKKVDELIKVFTEIRILNKNTYLVIVGDGFERDRLMQFTKRLGNERIIFKGYVPENEVLSYFGASDIFVNPAHIEPYGKVYIEAMSAKKPVVTTSGAGAVEDRLCINDVNSLIVGPGNLKELKNAIIRLIENKNLRITLGENACELAIQKFNYEKALLTMKDFWEKTVEHAKNRYSDK